MKTYKKYKNKLLKIKEPGIYLKYMYKKLWVNEKKKVVYFNGWVLLLQPYKCWRTVQRISKASPLEIF